MSKYYLIRFLQALAIATLIPTNLSNQEEQICVCMTGFKPIQVADGIICNDKYRIHPCNSVEGPKCICSGDESNVLKDNTGVWCTLYKKGKELKRWPCENTKDWEDFRKTIKVHKVELKPTNKTI